MNTNLLMRIMNTKEIFIMPQGVPNNRRIVGRWVRGNFYFTEKFNKVPARYYRPEADTDTKTQNGTDIGNFNQSKTSQINNTHITDRDKEDGHTYQSILTRRGQPEFQKRLLEAYQGCCAITGCDTEAALEAAHTTPHSEEQSYELTVESFCGGIFIHYLICTYFQ